MTLPPTARCEKHNRMFAFPAETCRDCDEEAKSVSIGDAVTVAYALSVENKALRSQVQKLEIDIESGFMKGAYACLQNLQEAERQRNALREALETYGQHTYECASHTSKDGAWLLCDCGWDYCEFNPERAT